MYANYRRGHHVDRTMQTEQSETSHPSITSFPSADLIEVVFDLRSIPQLTITKETKGVARFCLAEVVAKLPWHSDPSFDLTDS